MKDFDLIGALEEFRQRVDEIASEEFDSHDELEMMLYHEKMKHFNLERSVPLYDLCKRLKRILDSSLIEFLMEVSAESKMRLEVSLLEPLEEDCRQFAAAMSTSEDPTDLSLSYEYHPEGHTHTHIGTIPLLVLRVSDGRYRISNADTSTTLRDIEEYLGDAREGKALSAHGAY